MNADNLIKKLQSADKHFATREGQMQMVKFIERQLDQAEIDGKNVCVIEGQTGCGKSLGYLLSTIPYLLKAKKKESSTKLVISTANVSLQQQLLNSELPKLAAAGVNIKSVLAAGRGRYVCLDKLTQLLDEDSMQTLATNELRAMENMAHAFYIGAWDGLRDNLAENNACSDDSWSAINADQMTCTKSACPHYQNCAFYKARNQLKQADVIIANHALVLSDLEESRILPNPEDCIYVFDEAHHLPGIMRNRSEANISLLLAQSVFGQQGIHFVGQIVALNEHCVEKQAFKEKFVLERFTKISEALRAVYLYLGRYLEQQNDDSKVLSVDLTFEPVDKDIIALIHLQISKPLADIIQIVGNVLESAVASNGQNSGQSNVLFNSVLTKYKQILALNQTLLLFNDYEGEIGRIAKWIIRDKNSEDVRLNVGRVDVSDLFVEKLWGKCRFSILTSATMTALSSFDRFLNKVGLSSQATPTLQVRSPFDFKRKGRLSLIKDLPYPNWKDEREHTLGIYNKLFNDFASHQAGLMLFTSKRQMDCFIEMLTPEQEEFCLVQYTDTRNNLVKRHKFRVDNNQRSLLIGVQSLSEGLDLPGNYLTFVGIAKIPFVDTSCPIGNAEIELHKRQNGNAFYDIILADASAKLNQSTGRLLRTVYCQGEIVVYDKRLATKHYASALLNSLPPYQIHKTG